MEKTELIQALQKRNFLEAMRIAVTDLPITGNFEPFEGLIASNEAIVRITMDDYNNIQFHKYEVPRPTLELHEHEEKPRKVKKT